jgi:hypothetical protein
MKVVKALGLDLRPRREALIPGFMELNQVDRGFCRRGINGSYLDEMPEDLHELFWSKPENAAAMTLTPSDREHPRAASSGPREPKGAD